MILSFIFSDTKVNHKRACYLYFHRCSNNHGLLQEVVIERRWMVIQVQYSHKDLSQVVLPLSVFCFHIEVIFGLHLCIQACPRLCVDDPGYRLDEEPVDGDIIL